MSELGITTDSSIFPAARAHGGFPSYKEPTPSLLKYQGITLKELPINYATLFGKPIIYSGGGYFRLFPYSLIKKWSQSSDYIMTYFHPRDFDPNQPMIKELSITRKFKSYTGLKQAEAKLNNWFNDFQFIDIQQAVKKIDWKKTPTVHI